MSVTLRALSVIEDSPDTVGELRPSARGMASQTHAAGLLVRHAEVADGLELIPDRVDVVGVRVHLAGEEHAAARRDAGWQAGHRAGAVSLAR